MSGEDEARYMIGRAVDIAEQLRRFNEARLQEFGRGPHPDNRLDIPPTGIGGDVLQPEAE